MSEKRPKHVKEGGRSAARGFYDSTFVREKRKHSFLVKNCRPAFQACTFEPTALWSHAERGERSAARGRRHSLRQSVWVREKSAQGVSFLTRRAEHGGWRLCHARAGAEAKGCVHEPGSTCKQLGEQTVLEEHQRQRQAIAGLQMEAARIRECREEEAEEEGQEIPKDILRKQAEAERRNLLSRHPRHGTKPRYARRGQTRLAGRRQLRQEQQWTVGNAASKLRFRATKAPADESSGHRMDRIVGEEVSRRP